MMKQNNYRKREFSISSGWVVALALLLAAPLSLLAQDTGGISGRVYNEFTGNSLQGAIVRVVGTNAVDRTGLDGRFYLSGVPAGSQQLSVNYVGMDSSLTSVSVAAGQTQVVSVNMTSEIYELEAFTVVGQVIGQARAINMQKTAPATFKN